MMAHCGWVYHIKNNFRETERKVGCWKSLLRVGPGGSLVETAM
jgi:hypothetical protein